MSNQSKKYKNEIYGYPIAPTQKVWQILNHHEWDDEDKQLLKCYIECPNKINFTDQVSENVARIAMEQAGIRRPSLKDLQKYMGMVKNPHITFDWRLDQHGGTMMNPVIYCHGFINKQRVSTEDGISFNLQRFIQLKETVQNK